MNKISDWSKHKSVRRINTGQLPQYSDMTIRKTRAAMRKMTVKVLYELRETAVRVYRASQGKDGRAMYVVRYAEELIALRVGAETVL